ncbi:MAG: hypothetical protein E7058_10815 [Lentisphaerae bacterium]|nr:hypothetical protein [Lentisphaerota bacterium]
MKKIWIGIFLIPWMVSAAEKVVSLSPAVTDLIIFCGGSNRLVGRSSACDQLEVRHLPMVGDLGKPFVEAVLRSSASAVISDASHPQAQWEILERCGVRVEVLQSRTLDDLPVNVQKIGSVLQLPGAGRQAAELEKKIRQLKDNIPQKRKRAVVLFWSSPLISCGKDTFIDHALTLAGVENVAAAAGRGYFILAPEYLIAAKPELLIFIGVPASHADDLLRKAVFRRLRSCRRIFLDDRQWSRLSPGLPDAVAALKAEISVE